MNDALRILAIDDEAVVLASVERVCGCEGILVDTASDGRAGLARLRERHYALVLCDMIMEGMDGLAFLGALARSGYPTRVVMMTGCAIGEEAAEALKCGAAEFLTKPFTPDELMAVIRRMVGESAPGQMQPPAPPVCPAPGAFYPERGTP